MRNTIVIVISILLLVGLFGEIALAVNIELDLGLGTGLSYPEVVSFNSRFLADISLRQSSNPRFIGIIRPEVAPSSFLGISVTSIELSLIGEYNTDRINPYLGIGGGIILTNTSVGSDSSSLFHGLGGVKLIGKGEVLPKPLDFFAQGKLRSHPTEDYQFVLEFGFLY